MKLKRCKYCGRFKQVLSEHNRCAECDTQLIAIKKQMEQKAKVFHNNYGDKNR